MFFFFSETEPKGTDCYDQFATMQECFARYPTVYNKSGGNGDDDDDENEHTMLPNGNLLAPESNVDTVDQLEESDKTSTKIPDTNTTNNNKSIESNNESK